MAVWYDCMTGLQKNVKACNITAIPDANVVIRKLPWVRGATLPGVILAPVPETIQQVNNKQLEIGYGVHVLIVRAGNQNLTAGLDSINDWREAIETKLRETANPDASSVINTRIEPSGLIAPSAFLQMYDISHFVARCISREDFA